MKESPWATFITPGGSRETTIPVHSKIITIHDRSGDFVHLLLLSLNEVLHTRKEVPNPRLSKVGLSERRKVITSIRSLSLSFPHSLTHSLTLLPLLSLSFSLSFIRSPHLYNVPLYHPFAQPVSKFPSFVPIQQLLYLNTPSQKTPSFLDPWLPHAVHHTCSNWSRISRMYMYLSSIGILYVCNVHVHV